MSYDNLDDSPDESGTTTTLYLEPARIPDFEGKEVSQTKVKITSVAGLEVDDRVWGMDEFVRLEIEAKVVNVAHNAEEKSGLLVRVHTLKAVDCRVLPWGDEGN